MMGLGLLGSGMPAVVSAAMATEDNRITHSQIPQSSKSIGTCRAGCIEKLTGAPHALQSVIRQSTHGIAAHAATSCVLQAHTQSARCRPN